MSWHASFKNRAAFDANTPSSGHIPPAGEGVDQYEVARKAATAVIDSGVVGHTTKDFTINLSGHSNARHEPAKGYANDTITIGITQL